MLTRNKQPTLSFRDHGRLRLSTRQIRQSGHTLVFSSLSQMKGACTCHNGCDRSSSYNRDNPGS
jgi:hypothetical protein